MWAALLLLRYSTLQFHIVPLGSNSNIQKIFQRHMLNLLGLSNTFKPAVKAMHSNCKRRLYPYIPATPSLDCLHTTLPHPHEFMQIANANERTQMMFNSTINSSSSAFWSGGWVNKAGGGWKKKKKADTTNSTNQPTVLTKIIEKYQKASKKHHETIPST